MPLCETGERGKSVHSLWLRDSLFKKSLCLGLAPKHDFLIKPLQGVQAETHHHGAPSGGAILPNLWSRCLSLLW